MAETKKWLIKASFRPFTKIAVANKLKKEKLITIKKVKKTLIFGNQIVCLAKTQKAKDAKPEELEKIYKGATVDLKSIFGKDDELLLTTEQEIQEKLAELFIKIKENWRFYWKATKWLAILIVGGMLANYLGCRPLQKTTNNRGRLLTVCDFPEGFPQFSKEQLASMCQNVVPTQAGPNPESFMVPDYGKYFEAAKTIGPKAGKYSEEEINSFLAIASGIFNMPPEILKAVRQIESGGGANTGKRTALSGLQSRYPTSSSKYQANFSALVKICNELGLNYQNVPGSSAGAIGTMQFMPSSWLLYGIDANMDNRKDPWDDADSIVSAAYLLIRNGWHTKGPVEALLGYNRSMTYVDMVTNQARRYGWQGNTKVY